MKTTDTVSRFCGSATGRSRVHTLVFDRTLWQPAEAKRWATKHNFTAENVDVMRGTLRIRQDRAAKKACSYRMIPFGQETGIQALVEFQGSKKTKAAEPWRSPWRHDVTNRQGSNLHYFDVFMSRRKRWSRVGAVVAASHEDAVQEALKKWSGTLRVSGRLEA